MKENPSIQISSAGCLFMIFLICLVIFLEAHGGAIAEKIVNGVC